MGIHEDLGFSFTTRFMIDPTTDEGKFVRAAWDSMVSSINSLRALHGAMAEPMILSALLVTGQDMTATNALAWLETIAVSSDPRDLVALLDHHGPIEAIISHLPSEF